jgi:hypothetical protein
MIPVETTPGNRPGAGGGGMRIMVEEVIFDTL